MFFMGHMYPEFYFFFSILLLPFILDLYKPKDTLIYLPHLIS